MWSLDFFQHLIPPFCLSSSLTNIHVLFMELISAFYPLILMLLTYLLIELHARNMYLVWKPFNKCVAKLKRSYDPKASIFNAFATVLLLSFSKILFTSINSVYQVNVFTSINSVYQVNISSTYNALYYNPYEPSAVHLPYFIPVIALIIITTQAHFQGSEPILSSHM